ncbi:MAG: histidine kinase [Bradyrhizobium sp.]|nr:histidine kinase [Bradyrhizobium sp.]
MLKSLRARLFLGLTAVIVLTGVIGGWFAYTWAYDEAIEMQDSVLMQIAAFASGAPVAVSQPVKGVDAEAEISLVELGSTPHGRPDDRRLWTLQDGLNNEARDGQPVRAYLRTRADGSRFAVTQRTDMRDEIARDMALRTLLPIAALVPCLLIVTALVIGYSFRPMVQLAADLDARKQDDLRELPVSEAPRELHAFLSSINALLRRLQIMMDQQKRFIADAAHELRTPVTALSVQAENLEIQDLPPEARERLTALRGGIGRTRLLLEQLLVLARQDAAQAVDDVAVRLDSVAKEVVADLLGEATSKGIDLGFESVEEVEVLCEPTALASVVRNIIGNAVKFTPEGGRVDLGVYRADDFGILQVEDSGPGIPPDDLERIFEPFFRGGHSQSDGSGLGLSIVKRIVDRIGGSIELENFTVGERSGLRAIIRFPARL